MAIGRQNLRIVKNPSVLEDDYLSEHLLANDDKLIEIEDYLSAAVRRQRPLHVWCYGDPGTGKTATACHWKLSDMCAPPSVGIYQVCRD